MITKSYKQQKELKSTVFLLTATHFLMMVILQIRDWREL
jgi:hypothetical protein